jgi:hypothetical protein
MIVGSTQQFTSKVAGGLSPYTYQWYLNDSAVPGATANNWNFTTTTAGHYKVYLNVTDALNVKVQSNIITNITVNPLPTGTINPVYLMLSTQQQATFSKGQELTFTVTVLNQQNPQLEASLTLTITGPGGYSFYDFQPINVSANGVGEYSFSWVVPNVDGTYVLETSLAPAQLTAYDAKWIEVGESSIGSAPSQGTSFVVLKSLTTAVSVFPVLFGIQVFGGVYSSLLSPQKGKKHRKFLI